MTWTLNPGDGEKSIYVRFRSAGGGNADASDTIYFGSKAVTSVKQSTQSSLPSTTTQPTKTSIFRYTFKKFLSHGNIGQEVKQLQIRLQQLGFMPKNITPNGVFGPATQGAVIKLQKAFKLKPPAGYVGPGTRKVLNGG